MSEKKKQYKWYRITRPDGTTFNYPSTPEYMEGVFTKGGYSYVEIRVADTPDRERPA